MFKRVLVANRGVIAVRVVRACRDMGIEAVALYDPVERDSLHMRLADTCARLRSERGYADQEAILSIARETGADAIHPGYGFLAEEPSFAAACEAAGITFIGPSATTIELARDKIGALARVRAAGYATTRHSTTSYGAHEIDALQSEAGQIGYPLLLKPCSGGGGRGTRLVREAAQLVPAVRSAQAEAQAVYGDDRVYLEEVIPSSRYIEVPLLGDRHGGLIHMGERDGSIQRNNLKVITEALSPALSEEQRERLWRTALDIARLFGCTGACTVEFVIDGSGRPLFTEIKARIQIEHPVSEMITRIDVVREQLRIAAGLPLEFSQDEVRLRGCAMLCRINAEDPWRDYLPSPGLVRAFRVPGGPNVRVDTYAYAGMDVPVRYDQLLATLVVWGNDREECLFRLRRTLEDFMVSGIPTNLPLIQRLVDSPEFQSSVYTTDLEGNPLEAPELPEQDQRNLAVAAALAYLSRTRGFEPTAAPGTWSGWHRDARRLPS